MDSLDKPSANARRRLVSIGPNARSTVKAPQRRQSTEHSRPASSPRSSAFVVCRAFPRSSGCALASLPGSAGVSQVFGLRASSFAMGNRRAKAKPHVFVSIYPMGLISHIMFTCLWPVESSTYSRRARSLAQRKPRLDDARGYATACNRGQCRPQSVRRGSLPCRRVQPVASFAYFVNQAARATRNAPGL